MIKSFILYNEIYAHKKGFCKNWHTLSAASFVHNCVDPTLYTKIPAKNGTLSKLSNFLAVSFTHKTSFPSCLKSGTPTLYVTLHFV